MRPGLRLLTFLSLATMGALSASPPSFAADQSVSVPSWLQPHIGEGPGQIARIVL